MTAASTGHAFIRILGRCFTWFSLSGQLLPMILKLSSFLIVKSKSLLRVQAPRLVFSLSLRNSLHASCCNTLWHGFGQRQTQCFIGIILYAPLTLIAGPMVPVRLSRWPRIDKLNLDDSTHEFTASATPAGTVRSVSTVMMVGITLAPCAELWGSE